MSGNAFRGFPDPVLIVGGQVSVTGSTTINVEPIACKDINKIWPLITQENISVDISINGLNGLDTGTVQNSTTYYLYVIRSKQFANDLPVGFVFSLSDIAPSFPHASNIENYDLYRQIGKFRVNGSGQIEIEDQVLALKGIVDTYSELPGTPDDVLDIWVVRTGSGIWLINRKPAGLYGWDIGSASWVHLSAFPNQHNTANFELFDNADNTKRLKFNIVQIATGIIRNIFMPNKDITLFNEVANVDTISLSHLPRLTQGTTFIRAGGCVLNIDNYNKTNWTSIILVVQTANVGLNGATIELFDKDNNTQITTLSWVDAEDDTTKTADVTSYFQSKSGRFFLESNVKADGGGAASVFDFISLEVK
jgi:hypothetical protein